MSDKTVECFVLAVTQAWPGEQTYRYASTARHSVLKMLDAFYHMTETSRFTWTVTIVPVTLTEEEFITIRQGWQELPAQLMVAGAEAYLEAQAQEGGAT